LAGDIGGTKTRLALFTAAGERLESCVEETFPSREHGGLDEIVRAFVSQQQVSVTHAGFGVAGPVKHSRSETTNLPWVVDARQLAGQLGIASVVLINDLEANAYGVAALEAKDFVILSHGAPDAEGNAAIIAAGTGLGEAGLYWDGAQHHPFACEGGHTDFAPRNELEIELLRYLLTRFTRVSYERVLSGPGLYNIYQFLRDTGRGKEPVWLTEELHEQDPAATISQAALTDRSALCVQALDLFVSLYGAEAGNLALKVMATGGLYVGGGIAPKILQKLQDSTFVQAFLTKGRMQPLLEAMPVRVILNDKTALLGAARCALLRAVRTKDA
ncbi:MAG TPA: glucokinase, partial [Candidatus Binatia bacterium]|nr:glucokinase [Candidatus Binatia bacterium]